MSKIPIFIITRDRLDVLQKCIKSLKQLDTEYEVVIHDNDSTFEPLIEYLNRESEAGNLKVYWNKHNTLDDVTLSIQAHYKEGCTSDYYIVTDPDIELLDVNSDMLEFYIHLLNTYPDIKVVGPMLQIDDLPDHYPLKQKVIKSHTQQFWHKTPESIKYQEETYNIQRCYIDTTFGMYRKSFNFKRYNKGIRTYKPYSARHLDWYIDPKNLSNDQIYYLTTSSNIGHWSSTYLEPYVQK